MIDAVGLRVLVVSLAGWVNAHYHGERNHQGLANELIEGAPVVEDPTGRIRRRQRVGGLLNYYCRAA